MKQAKLKQLASAWGMSVDALLAQYTTDSVAPAICMSEGCTFTSEYEPDCRDGWCDACSKRSMQSALILAGVV